MTTSTPATYRVGIIGLRGDIAVAEPSVHIPDPFLAPPIPHTPAYAANPRAKVVAVADLLPAYLTQYVKSFGPVATYTDYRQMLAQEKLDIVSVVTADHVHAQMVVDAAAAGAKGIYCEKPIATNLTDGDRMVAAAQQHGAHLLINYVRRWDSWWQRARALVAEGRIGTLSRIVAHMGGQRAMLFRNGSHLLNLTSYFVNADPLWLVGQMEEGYEDRREYQGDGGKNPALDPGASAFIQFANGVRAYVEVSKRTASHFWLELHGSKGHMRLNDREGILTVEGEGGLHTEPLPGPGYSDDSMARAVAELVGLIENGGESVSSGRMALRTLEMMVAIMRSSAQGVTKVTWPVARP